MKLEFKYFLLFLIIILFSNKSNGQYSTDSVSTPFNCIGKIDSIADQNAFTIVEEMPVYSEDIVSYLLKNIKLNKESQTEMQTRVVLSFVIDITGQAINVCIKKPYYPDKLTNLEKAALESISKMKPWTPGKQRGRKVPVKMDLPIIVELR